VVLYKKAGLTYCGRKDRRLNADLRFALVSELAHVPGPTETYGLYALHMLYCYFPVYSSRQKWCPESEAGLVNTMVQHTAAGLFDPATQDRSTTYITMRVGVDRRAKRSQR